MEWAEVETAASLVRLVGAADYAAQMHRDQRRKDEYKAPYVNHPITVARLIARHVDFENSDGGFEHSSYEFECVLSAALLHDTVEDTDATIAAISKRFGDIVASLVEEVTDDKTLPKGERKRRQWRNIGARSVGAQLIKMADKHSNCSDAARSVPPKWSLHDAQAYFAWSRAIVLAVPDRAWHRRLREAALKETEGTFNWQGHEVPRVPVDDATLEQYVEDYLVSLDQ